HSTRLFHHQARSAVRYSASRIKVALHPAKGVRHLVLTSLRTDDSCVFASPDHDLIINVNLHVAEVVPLSPTQRQCQHTNLPYNVSAQRQATVAPSVWVWGYRSTFRVGSGLGLGIDSVRGTPAKADS
ncbi:unnamed protein product, partial [Ectocarpus sp. 12 AP-2014]